MSDNIVKYDDIYKDLAVIGNCLSDETVDVSNYEDVSTMIKTVRKILKFFGGKVFEDYSEFEINVTDSDRQNRLNFVQLAEIPFIADKHTGFDVDWGDGYVETYDLTSLYCDNPVITHQYDRNGTYKLKVQGYLGADKIFCGNTDVLGTETAEAKHFGVSQQILNDADRFLINDVYTNVKREHDVMALSAVYVDRRLERAKWLVVPDNAESIPDNCLSNGLNIQAVYFGQNPQLTSIGDNAFCDSLKLYSLTIPNSVEEIGVSAFNNCYYLKHLVLPSRLKRLGEGAFEHINTFECNIVFPNLITKNDIIAYYDVLKSSPRIANEFYSLHEDELSSSRTAPMTAARLFSNNGSSDEKKETAKDHMYDSSENGHRAEESGIYGPTPDQIKSITNSVPKGAVLAGHLLNVYLIKLWVNNGHWLLAITYRWKFPLKEWIAKITAHIINFFTNFMKEITGLIQNLLMFIGNIFKGIFNFLTWPLRRWINALDPYDYVETLKKDALDAIEKQSSTLGGNWGPFEYTEVYQDGKLITDSVGNIFNIGARLILSDTETVIDTVANLIQSSEDFSSISIEIVEELDDPEAAEQFQQLCEDAGDLSLDDILAKAANNDFGRKTKEAGKWDDVIQFFTNLIGIVRLIKGYMTPYQMTIEAIRLLVKPVEAARSTLVTVDGHKKYGATFHRHYICDYPGCECNHPSSVAPDENDDAMDYDLTTVTTKYTYIYDKTINKDARELGLEALDRLACRIGALFSSAVEIPAEGKTKREIVEEIAKYTANVMKKQSEESIKSFKEKIAKKFNVCPKLGTNRS